MKNPNNEILNFKQVSRLWFCKLANNKNCTCSACTKLRKVATSETLLIKIIKHLKTSHKKCQECQYLVKENNENN